MSLGSSNAKFVLVVIGLAALAGAVVYGFDRLQKIEERMISESRVKTEIENKGRSVAELVKQMRSAAENYVRQSASEGLSLPVGHVVTLEELRASKGLDDVHFEISSKLVRFAYFVLDDQAPPDAVLLELVTADTHAVIDKSGKGALYKLGN